MSIDVQATAAARPLAAGPPVLEVADLEVWVRRRGVDLPLVRGLSYSVRAGESLAIVGESGAGKSIGVRAVLGLLDHRRFTVTGSARLGGRDVLSLSRRERSGYVPRVASLVFQDPGRSLNPTMRVGHQIAEAILKGSGKSAGLNRDQARARAVELMAEVGIAAPQERFHAYPHQLSGGMKQRIVIAIAFACEPQVLFCDEPTSSLDVTTQAAIMDLLRRLRSDRGTATVMITHDLALAASQAERVMVMYAGQAVETLPATGIATRARMPYTRALVRAVPEATSVRRPPRPIDGLPPDPAELPPGCSFEPRCTFARSDCAAERPALLPLAADQEVRCLHPLADAADPAAGEATAEGARR